MFLMLFLKSNQKKQIVCVFKYLYVALDVIWWESIKHEYHMFLTQNIHTYL